MGHGERDRIAEPIAVGAIDVGMGEQALADRLAGRADVTDTAHGVAALTAFHLGIDAGNRGGVVIERPDGVPDAVSRVLEHGAVVGLGMAESSYLMVCLTGKRRATAVCEVVGLVPYLPATF
jgi:hypothetical protein